MKNKIILFISALIIFTLQFFSAYAENFIFESDTIEIQKEGNIILAKDGVKVITKDGLEITADEAEYDKKKDFLKLHGNVVVSDNIKKIIIFSDSLEYNKKNERIFSEGPTKIKFEKNYDLRGSDIEYLRSDQIISSKK